MHAAHAIVSASLLLLSLLLTHTWRVLFVLCVRLQKSNDLYEFAQSQDLKGINRPLITKIKEVIYSDKFRSFLKKVSRVSAIFHRVVGLLLTRCRLSLLLLLGR